MFPRSLIFFLAILAIDIVLKSIREKNKTQKGKVKKMDQMKKQVRDVIEQNYKEPDRQYTERQYTAKQYTEKQDTVRTPTVEAEIEKRFKPIESAGITVDKLEKKNSKSSKEQLKKDVLRGIIFSEILSKPKAFSKNRKSM